MELKTAEEILSTNPNWSRQDPDVIDAMQIYALQVAKATRTECIKVYNESGGNDFEVANINLTQFIK